MLSYLHAFHAGNFADVHKHATLTLLINYLKNKEKPFSFLDLYAGRGLYDLSSAQAQKTAEAEQGIARLPNQNWPASLEDYFRIVRSHNPAPWPPRRYPGSPTLALALLRAQDRLILNELHPQEYQALRDNLPATDKRIHIHQRQAEEALIALTPPQEKRGLVLLDPSFEQKNDYQQLPNAIAQFHQKWPQGTLMLWYPLLAGGHHVPMLRQLEAIPASQLRSELQVRARGIGMHGSGIWVLNPPWTLETELKKLKPWFAHLYQEQGTGSFSVSSKQQE